MQQGRDAVVRLAMSAKNGESNEAEVMEAGSGLLAEDVYYEDNIFFEVPEEEKPMQIYVQDKTTGKLRKLDPSNDTNLTCL